MLENDIFETYIFFMGEHLNLTPKEIAVLWKEQMKKGYLKLSILFVLIKGEAHGYEIMKKIGEFTLGLLIPTPGAIYPALNELESKGLIEGRWENKGGKKVKIYKITKKGREVFREAVEKHFNLISATQNMLLKELEDLGIISPTSSSSGVYVEAMKILLLDEDALPEKKIEALKRLMDGCTQLKENIEIMIENIEKRIIELKNMKNNVSYNFNQQDLYC